MVELGELGFIYYEDENFVKYKDIHGHIHVAYKASDRQLFSCKTCCNPIVKTSGNKKYCNGCAAKKNQKCRQRYSRRMRVLKKRNNLEPLSHQKSKISPTKAPK